MHARFAIVGRKADKEVYSRKSGNFSVARLSMIEPQHM